jgi:hypothetical protein
MKNQLSDSRNWILFLKSIDQKIESWVDFFIEQFEENQEQPQ